MVVASGLPSSGMGSMETVRLLFGSNSSQSKSGSTFFNFLFFRLMGSAHLREEMF